MNLVRAASRALTTAVFSLMLVLALSACRTGSDTGTQADTTAIRADTSGMTGETIADLAMTDPQFSTFVRALQAAGLTETLRSGTYTVFAPTNAAFDKLPQGQLDSLLNHTEELNNILLYHVVQGEVMAADLGGMTNATPLQGSPINISSVDGQVMLNGTSTVRQKDVDASNGVIHVIDTVLLPPAQ